MSRNANGARRNLLCKSKLVGLCVYIFSLSRLTGRDFWYTGGSSSAPERTAPLDSFFFFFLAAAIRVSKFDGGNGVDVIGRELAARILMKSQTRKRETKRFQRESERKKKKKKKKSGGRGG